MEHASQNLLVTEMDDEENSELAKEKEKKEAVVLRVSKNNDDVEEKANKTEDEAVALLPNPKEVEATNYKDEREGVHDKGKPLTQDVVEDQDALDEEAFERRNVNIDDSSDILENRNALEVKDALDDAEFQRSHGTVERFSYMYDYAATNVNYAESSEPTESSEQNVEDSETASSMDVSSITTEERSGMGGRQQKQPFDDDSIMRHLSRSAMMTSYRRRILMESTPRRYSSGYHPDAYYSHQHHYPYAPEQHQISAEASLWEHAPQAPGIISGDVVVPSPQLHVHHSAPAPFHVDAAPDAAHPQSRASDSIEDVKESGPSDVNSSVNVKEKSFSQDAENDDDDDDGGGDHFPSTEIVMNATNSYFTAAEEPSNSNVDERKAKEHTDDNIASNTAPFPYGHEGSEDSNYEHYALLVDPNEGDRAVVIELYSFARPHMRAFHLAWMSFFVAFFTWFAITPLLSEVARSLRLNRSEIWTSSTFAVAGSAVTRLLIGPLCDKYGARWAMSGTLVISAIPTALLGLTNSATGLYMVRLVIGVAGSAFVTSQYWMSTFFTWEVAGTANAIVAGWGNLGGGVTQVAMGALFFPLFKIVYGGTFGGATRLPEDDDNYKNTEEDRAADVAWRTVCIIPALLCFVMAFCMVRYSDDCPKGNYGKLRREGLRVSVSARRSLQKGLWNFNTWILLLQYGCCFGVEITMINASALYFKEEFGQSTESAAAIASIFGWMNLFARGFGGFMSDVTNSKWGVRGRLAVQTVSLLLEGVFVIIFSETHTLGGAIAAMVVFSVLVQAAEGSTYGIVPYVNPMVTGAISGVVGAGGNIGGVGFSLIFREHAYRSAFKTMGYIVMGSAVFTPLFRLQGHRSLLCGTDAPEVESRRASHMEQMGAIPSVHHVVNDTSQGGISSASSQLRATVVDDEATKATDTAV